MAAGQARKSSEKPAQVAAVPQAPAVPGVEAALEAPAVPAPAAAPGVADPAILDAATQVIAVSTLPGVARFCRGGRCFGPEPMEVALAELDSAELAQLLAEPNLVVKEGG